MTAKIIDGKQVAADMRDELKAKVAKLKEESIVPGLAVIAFAVLIFTLTFSISAVDDHMVWERLGEER